MALYSYQDIILDQKNQALVECTLCSLKFEKNNDPVIAAHVSGPKHKSAYLKRLRIANSIVVNKYDDEVHCRLCCELVCETESYYEINTHIKSAQHKESFENIEDLIQGEFLVLPEGNTVNGSKVYCSICKCYLSGFTHQLIDQHICGNKHEKARAIAVQPLNGIFPVEGSDDRLWCKICDEYFDNYIEIILDHVDNDDDHTSKLGAIEDLCDEEDISIEQYLTSLSEDKAWCGKCKTKVPCNENNLKEHIDGTRHQQNVAQDLKSRNGIFPVEGSNDELWCKICKEHLDNTVDDIFDHISGAHESQLDDIEELIEGENISIQQYLTNFSDNRAYCYKCGVWITCHEYNLRQHIEGRKHSY